MANWVSDLAESLAAGFGCEVRVDHTHEDIPLPAGMSAASAMTGIGNSYVEPLPGTMVPA